MYILLRLFSNSTTYGILYNMDIYSSEKEAQNKAEEWENEEAYNYCYIYKIEDGKLTEITED